MRSEDADHPHSSIAASVWKPLPIITSETEPIRVDFLPESVLQLPGRLGMTIAPGKCNLGRHACWQRDLNQDLARLQQHYQVDWLITLLEVPELELLQVPDLLDRIAAHGIRTSCFPIPDFGTPASMSALMQLVTEIMAAVAQAQTVVIHCKAGLGRTGLVTAACLVTIGYDPEAAFAQVRQARPGSVETQEQEQYVAQFAAIWSQKRDLI